MHYENDLCWSQEGTDSFHNFHSHNNESLNKRDSTKSLLNKNTSNLGLQQHYSLVCSPYFMFSFFLPWHWGPWRSLEILDVRQRLKPRAKGLRPCPSHAKLLDLSHLTLFSLTRNSWQQEATALRLQAETELPLNWDINAESQELLSTFEKWWLNFKKLSCLCYCVGIVTMCKLSCTTSELIKKWKA